jgi:hypothetical protein
MCVKGPGALIFSVHTVFSIGRANRHHNRRISELCNYKIIKTGWQQMHFHLDEACSCSRSLHGQVQLGISFLHISTQILTAVLSKIFFLYEY